MQCPSSLELYYVNDDFVVEVTVIFDGELEPLWRWVMLLAVVTELANFS